MQVNRDLIVRYAQLMKIMGKDPQGEKEFEQYQTALREVEEIDAFLKPFGLKIDYAHDGSYGMWCIRAHPLVIPQFGDER